MSDSTKMTHPTAATVERIEAGAETRQATTSPTNDTTPTPPGQAVKIADLLGHGQSAAVPLRHLKELAGLPGREVRRMIQAERLRGIPILSDNINGYYLAGDAQEREKFIKSMRGRAAEIVKVAEAVGRGTIGGEQVRTPEIF